MRLGVLGSTRGTNLDAIVAAIKAKTLPATIEIVVSNKLNSGILARAASFGLLTHHIDATGLTREVYDQQVSAVLQQYGVELIVLIGYMRILSAPFVNAWQNKIINVHPSLLPAFAGKMDLDVHRAVIEAGVDQTGCTVHQVTEEVDAGSVVIQKTCPVYATDTPEILKKRVQSLEGEALVSAITALGAG